MALLFLLPTCIGLIVFRLVPIIWSFALSFYEWKIFDTPEFVGLANYRQIASSELALTYFSNTALYSLMYVSGSIVIATLMAIVLNKAFRFSALFRGAFFLPYITSAVAVTLAWRWIFASRFGLLNNLLLWLGVTSPPAWLADPFWALPSVAIVAVWKDAGFYMLLLLAGLQTIDPTLYEAARVDGAGRWRRFYRITLPLLSRSLFVVAIIALIQSTQTFEITYSLTGGGPNHASTTLAFSIYQHAFVDFKFGYASALAYLLCFVLGLLTLLKFQIRKRWQDD